VSEICCPHCQSSNVESFVGVSADVNPPIYYDIYDCNDCKKDFAVKRNNDNPCLAIIRDFWVGGYFPDGMGLGEQPDE